MRDRPVPWRVNQVQVRCERVVKCAREGILRCEACRTRREVKVSAVGVREW